MERMGSAFDGNAYSVRQKTCTTRRCAFGVIRGTGMFDLSSYRISSRQHRRSGCRHEQVRRHRQQHAHQWRDANGGRCGRIERVGLRRAASARALCRPRVGVDRANGGFLLAIELWECWVYTVGPCRASCSIEPAASPIYFEPGEAVVMFCSLVTLDDALCAGAPLRVRSRKPGKSRPSSAGGVMTPSKIAGYSWTSFMPGD